MAATGTVASNLRWTWCGAMLILSLSLILPLSAQAQLKTGFYKDTCPNVESLVRNAVTLRFKQNFATSPGTLRLFFHDCFVRGCDASLLLTGPKGKMERDHPDDGSLENGFDTVVKAKAAVDSDARCKNKVSCADILALATREVVSLTGGPYYEVELGRRDGRISNIANVEHSLPHPDFNLDNLNAMFSSHGLTQTDMIALSGAHTIGFSHCVQFSKRIYNFSAGNPIDPTLNRAYALELRKTCPPNADPTIMAKLDFTPTVFDNTYFKNLQQRKSLLTSDQALFSDPRSRSTVNLFASNPTAFKKAFIQAITKLGRVGVNTGNAGEIRRDCTIVN